MFMDHLHYYRVFITLRTLRLLASPRSDDYLLGSPIRKTGLVGANIRRAVMAS